MKSPGSFASAALALAAVTGALYAQDTLQVTAGLDRMVDSYLLGIASRHLQDRMAKIASLQSSVDVAARQAYIRRTVLNEIGGLPTTKAPLNARITGTVERDGYRVEKLIFESLPNFYVTANVYVPKGTPPYPALLGTAGHDADGKAQSPVYQSAWISLARRGILVLAYDPPGQGERICAGNEHISAGLQCYLTGTNLARYEVWDGIRAFDYLLTRKDVDGKRIGVAGNSGGGTQTAYLQVLEPRLAAAAPSCYLTSWETLWGTHGPQDPEQVFAGFIRDGLDFGDFLIAFAPRPVKMMTAIRDAFPIAGARATFTEAQRVYGLLDAEQKIGFFEYDDGHGWSKPRRQATYEWMERWLNGRRKPGTEQELHVESPQTLNCTPTGQLCTSLGGETVHSLNLRMAEELRAKRAAQPLAIEALKVRILDRLAIPATRPRPAVTTYPSRSGYIGVQKISLETEPGITVPALVCSGRRSQGPRPAVIYVNPAGKAADIGRGRDIRALQDAGYLVLAPDLRGWGESATSRHVIALNATYQTALRALLVGKTMTGMQVQDLLGVFDYLAARKDVDPQRISMVGKGSGGIAVLYAAALEKRVEKVLVEGAMVSYMDLARSVEHVGLDDVFVPGVLADFDLPDVAAAIAPRRVWISDPRTPAGRVVPLDECSRQYALASQAFRLAGSAENFSVLDRPKGAWFNEVYSQW